MSTALACSFLSNTGVSQTEDHDPTGSSIVRSIIGPDSDGGQSSIGFILTVCSSMMGSTLMTLPWAFENAGLVASLIMISIVGMVSYYTCFRILHWGTHPNGNFHDFSDMCEHYLGGWSKHVANGTSVGVCVGVLAAYHVLMASSIQHVILAIADHTHSTVNLCCGSGNFMYVTSSAIVAVCVFPMLCSKSLGWLMRIGSFGSISVMYNAAFIIGNALLNWPAGQAQTGHTVKVAGTMQDFGVFFGTLGLSLFIHNLLLQMGAGHRCAASNPSVVKRDLAIAYCFAVIAYIAVGALPAVALELGAEQFSYLPNGQLPQNILLAYGHNSWGAIVGQTLLALQILAVYPLIATVIRRQFFSSVMGTDWPGWTKALSFSFLLVCFTTAVSCVYPKPGNVVGYVGVYTAIVYMLGLPLAVHVKASKANGRGSLTSTVLHTLVWAVMSFAFILQFL